MEKRYTRRELLFFGAYILWFTASALGLTRLSYFLGPFRVIFTVYKPIVILLLLLKILEDREWIKNKIIFFLIIAVITFLAFWNSRAEYILYTICFSYAMKDINFRDILKVTVIIQGSIMILTFSLVGKGIIEDGIYGDVVWKSTVIQSMDNKRHDLGYIHPNTTSAVLLFLTIMVLCLRKNIKIIEIMIAILLNYLLYMKTGSRTSLLLIIIFLPFMWYINKIKRFSRIWKKAFLFASVAIPVAILLLQIFYDPSYSLFTRLNQLLSGRLGLGYSGFHNFGITLFGQAITWRTDERYNIVDCAYMYILISYGILFYLLISIFCFLTMKELVKKEERSLCAAFLAWMAFGMIENVILMISFQPFCLLLGRMTKTEKT